MSSSNDDIFIIRYKTEKFNPKQLVKYITCTYSGNCYLVADINDNNNREWIMYYDLYPVNKNLLDRFLWYHNPEFQILADKFLANSQV